MGITEQGLEFLLSGKRRGIAFDRTMTIGRQFLLVPADRRAAMVSIVAAAERHALSDVLSNQHRFAEPLLRYLGAEEVCSIDGSDYEGATYTHDFNTPLPSSFFQRFSVVLDGGCLEHVFDFPTAIRNCMQMVEVGGHLLCMPPVNNAAGHGFYQFSPELYFRVLSPENGFEVERMLLAEVGSDAVWYQVVDPAVAGRRVEFTTRHQAYLYIQARRIDERPPLATPPVQSDYDDMWRRGRGTDQGAPDPVSSASDAGGSVTAEVLESLRRRARRYPALHVPIRRFRQAVGEYRELHRPYDPDHFKPLGDRLS